VERAYLPKPRARQRLSAHKPALTALAGGGVDRPGAGIGRRSEIGPARGSGGGPRSARRGDRAAIRGRRGAGVGRPSVVGAARGSGGHPWSARRGGRAAIRGRRGAGIARPSVMGPARRKECRRRGPPSTSPPYRHGRSRIANPLGASSDPSTDPTRSRPPDAGESKRSIKLNGKREIRTGTSAIGDGGVACWCERVFVCVRAIDRLRSQYPRRRSRTRPASTSATPGARRGAEHQLLETLAGRCFRSTDRARG
jgi:hypothetical protein